RNPVTAAMEGMHTIIVGSIDGLAVAVPRYRAAWEEHQGSGTLTVQGHEPMIGLVVHLVVAETDDEAMRIAQPACEKYRWNLAAPRGVEGEKRNLTQFMQTKDGSFGFVGERPKGLPTREMRRDIDAELERFDQVKQGSHPNRIGGVALAGTPRAVLEYMDEYVATGADYFVCSFQWGDIAHVDAMRSIELFATEVMPRYASAASPARAQPGGEPPSTATRIRRAPLRGTARAARDPDPHRARPPVRPRIVRHGGQGGASPRRHPAARDRPVETILPRRGIDRP